ncbi:VOC family protein [Fulvivirgaceae bacterium BMA10]|uniref:VOC family protein n=1 Tax=Splendidivirga corallicola TaxID=3051826 RepID=A0ABT8KL72_9BACT|nr:VOC family protein [Fulvivirgaceae bacterium BMA10]
MASRILHFEIPSENPEKSMIFYSAVFGWEFNQWGEQEYWLAKTGEDNVPGINGAIAKKREPNQPIINTLDVKDLDATAKAIESNGGQVVVPKMAIPTIGWLIYFQDPEGYVHGAMQADPDAK